MLRSMSAAPVQLPAPLSALLKCACCPLSLPLSLCVVANIQNQVEEGASNLDRMLKAQENDLVLGTLMKGYRMVRDAASSTFSSPQEQPLEPGPEPEWKVAKRQREEERQQEQQMQEMQDVLQRQQEEQQVQAQEQAQQQRGWRRWFGFKRSQPT